MQIGQATALHTAAGTAKSNCKDARDLCLLYSATAAQQASNVLAEAAFTAATVAFDEAQTQKDNADDIVDNASTTCASVDAASA